jgi:hypothetical protein
LRERFGHFGMNRHDRMLGQEGVGHIEQLY